MQKTIIILLFSLFFILNLQAQQSQDLDITSIFEAALELYDDGKYQEAVLAFEAISGSSEADLMVAKSYFALGDYQNAAQISGGIRSSAFSDVIEEARLVEALSLFRLRDYQKALPLLYILSQRAENEELRLKSERNFNTLNSFVTHDQRIQMVNDLGLSEDLLKSVLTEGMKRADRTYGQQYINLAIENRLPNTFVSELRRRFTEIPFEQKPRNPDMPEGMVYNLGVILPQQVRGEMGYEVSRQLYYGFLMAIDERNAADESRFFSVKVASKRDYDYDEDVTLAGLFNNLIEQNTIDFVFGPLFSEDAEELAQLSKNVKVPVISPLANSDELEGISEYFYQANPTFSTRGKVIADFALNDLEYDSLAVLVERNTAGVSEARAFRQIAEEKGAQITHFYNLDFQSMRFDVTNQIENFALNNVVLNDTTRVLVPVDALFLPLTGEAATTMIDNILTTLVALRSQVTIFGTEEWGMNEINTDAVANLDIVYTAIFNRSESDERVVNFRNDYRNRYGRDPSNFAFIGFDLGHYMVEVIENAVNPTLINQTIKEMPLFEGLNQHLFFDGQQINQGIQLIYVTLDGPVPAETAIETLRKVHYEELEELEDNGEFEDGEK